MSYHKFFDKTGEADSVPSTVSIYIQSSQYMIHIRTYISNPKSKSTLREFLYTSPAFFFGSICFSVRPLVATVSFLTSFPPTAEAIALDCDSSMTLADNGEFPTCVRGKLIAKAQTTRSTYDSHNA